MFEDSNEELEFWSSVPEGRFDRFSVRRQQAKAAKQHRTSRPVGSRSHDDTQSIPVVADPAIATGERRRHRHVDPLLRRMGTMAVVIALLCPSPWPCARATSPLATSRCSPQASARRQLPEATVAADRKRRRRRSRRRAVAEAAPVATIDIDALPEAVPVHTEAPKAATPKTATASATRARLRAATTPPRSPPNRPPARPASRVRRPPGRPARRSTP